MKNVFIELVRVVLALAIIIGITLIFVAATYILAFIIDYFQNTSYIVYFEFKDYFIKWLIILCFIEALNSKISKIKINKQPKGVYKLLAKWRKERNITVANYHVYCGNILEELLEPFYEDKEQINKLKQDMLVKYFNGFYANENKIVDTICDIQVFSINEISNMKYDNKQCMIETIKEVSSRVQDPQQKEEWVKNGAAGKWQKDANQDKTTLYVANYSICKR